MGGSGGGFPFPSAPKHAPPLVEEEEEEEQEVEDEDDDSASTDEGAGEPWPSGPPLRPLDYGKLVTPGDVHAELERTLESLGRWLEVVDGGLERILDSTAS